MESANKMNAGSESGLQMSYLITYTNDNVNDSFRKEPDAGKPHVRSSVRGVRP